MLLFAVPLSRVELARYLRRTMSGVEWDLWSRLRAKRLDGFRFRRKALVGPYIVDFACFSARLVVELGGEMFDRSPPSDAARAAWLESRGFRIVRFTPVDVAERLESVLDTIRVMLHAPLPNPLPFGERGLNRAGPGPGFFRARRFRRNRPAARAP
jgi:very-short-patch-repair endonuclease